jgi:hypothetical protein
MDLGFLSQLGGQQDIISQIFFYLLFFAFIFVYPKLTLTQAIYALEKEATTLENMARQTQDTVARKVERRPGAKLKESIHGFMDFFAVGPVDIDPYGVIKKLDMVIKQSDSRFRWFVAQAAPNMNEVEQANIRNALSGAMMTHQIAKVVRHYVETIKKYKILQLALIIQMQIPLITRMAKAASNATKAFVDGVPIGDGIGPLVVASMVKPRARVQVFKEEEFAVASAQVNGRSVWVCKATGPGAGTGYPGKFLLKFTTKNKIDRIITVDAALRLEGEKAGSIAEGVGVAMGGPGVDRYEIEEFAVKQKIPLDAVAIKVSDEEALGPMRKVIVDAVPSAVEMVKQAIRRAGARERILIMGVGNTCGVGDDAAAAKTAEQLIRKVARRTAGGKKSKGEETED